MEFVRHRVFSFAQESTRYCNYSKDKFGDEITYIIPCWLNIEEGIVDCFEDSSDIEDFYCNVQLSEDKWKRYSGYRAKTLCRWLKALDTAQGEYFDLLKEGWQPQQARSVLPNSLKTELIMTGFLKDWWGSVEVWEYNFNNKLVLKEKFHLLDFEKVEEEYSDRSKYKIIRGGFFPLRTDKAAHPQARELAVSLKEEFVKRDWI